MPNEDLLGPVEFQILAAALHLGPGEAYGMSIRHTIEKETRRGMLVGTLYSTLDRLKAKGYIQIELGEPTPERGGRAKEFVRVTGTGEKAYTYTCGVQKAMMRLTDGEGSYA